MSGEVELIAGARDLVGGTFADGYGEAANLAWPKDIVAVSDTELWMVEIGGNAGNGRLRQVTLTDPDAPRATVTTLQTMTGGPSTVSYYDGNWAVCKVGTPTNSVNGRSGGGIIGSFGSIPAIHPPHTVKKEHLAGSVSQPSSVSVGPGGTMLVVESAIWTGSATDNILAAASWFNGGARGPIVWNMGNFMGGANIHYIERSDGSGAHYGHAEYSYFRVENGGAIGNSTNGISGGITPPPASASFRAWSIGGSERSSFGAGFDHLDRLIFTQGDKIVACPDPGYGPLPADWEWGLSGAIMKKNFGNLQSLAVTPNGYIYAVTAPITSDTGPYNPGGTTHNCYVQDPGYMGHGLWRIKPSKHIKPTPFAPTVNLTNQADLPEKYIMDDPHFTAAADIPGSDFHPYAP